MLGREILAIYCIWGRGMKRFIRAKSHFISSIISPMIWLLIFAIGFSSMVSTGGSEAFEHLAIGIIIMTILLSSVYSGTGVIFDKEFGMLKEILVSPISRTSIVLGKDLEGITISMIQGSLVLFVSFLIGLPISGLFELLSTIMIMSFIAMAFINIGISIASRMESFEGFSLIHSFLVLPTLFLSGAFFPVIGNSSFPHWMQILGYVNPLTYGVDALYYSILGAPASCFSIMIDMVVLLSFALSTLLSGTYLFKKMSLS